MATVPRLLSTIITAKNTSALQVAKASSIPSSSLTRYLAGETDLRSSSLIKVLENLGIDLESLLAKRMQDLLNESAESSELGEALETLVRESDPISARTILQTVAVRSNSNSKKAEEARRFVITQADKLKSVRANA